MVVSAENGVFMYILPILMQYEHHNNDCSARELVRRVERVLPRLEYDTQNAISLCRCFTLILPSFSYTIKSHRPKRIAHLRNLAIG